MKQRKIRITAVDEEGIILDVITLNARPSHNKIILRLALPIRNSGKDEHELVIGLPKDEYDKKN